ncbi:hypothetical protein [Bacillus sp. JCM 19041]|uniref:hypothetical protein n=1 Tax=Bacillus sp. JCM 19041 TaxID=1460637 RepID=UPI0006D20CCB
MDNQFLFHPIVLEVFMIPVGIILGVVISTLKKRAFLGPIIYIAVTLAFYALVWLTYYPRNWSAFFETYFNHINVLFIDLFFAAVTLLLSFIVISIRINKAH